MRTVADLIFNRPLAIVRSKLQIIVRQVVIPRLNGSAPQALVVDADKSDRKPYSVTPGGVAMIDVDGTLVRKASGMNALSGLTAYEELSAELDQAATDNDVRGILLICDSPGGEVAGLFDFVDQVYAIRDQKPIYAAVSDSACSAAYAIASAAQRIFVTRTACCGSIGVVVCHVDQSGLDEMSGLKYTFIHAGARKIDGNPHEPLSDDARDVLQDEVDRVDALLAQTVARNRGMTIKAVKATEAALYFADDAIDAGLADELGTEDDACAALVAAIQGTPFQGGSISLGGNAKMNSRTLSSAQPVGRRADRTRSPGIVFAAKKLRARTLGNAEAPVDTGRRMSGIERRCLAMFSKTISTDIESLLGKVRNRGVISKCLKIRERQLAEAGQAPAEAQVNGVLEKCKAMAARMGVSPRTSARLEEETFNA